VLQKQQSVDHTPQVTPGGNALKFYSSIRLETMKNQRSENIPNAFTMRVKFKKNKVCPPREEPVQFDFIYAHGVEKITDTINVAKELGIVRSAGPTMKVKWNDKEEVTLAAGGLAGAKLVLESKPELLEQLRQTCIEKAMSSYRIVKTEVADVEDEEPLELSPGEA
jgi:recombination protein RecA